MFCKACGHNNASTASKCAACGEELGNNEALEMFQAQAQMSKGVSPAASFSGNDISSPGTTPPPSPQELMPSGVTSEQDTNDFFASVGAASPPPQAAPNPSKSSSGFSPPPKPPEQSFFKQAEAVDEPQFETDLGALRPEDEDKGPPEHPLYSVPTNPIIEDFIARRAAIRSAASESKPNR